jgi:amidase/aspartyl-tRNA(Asn)/glutamyl-tRNA(Gln) amidotransferase subunit A
MDFSKMKQDPAFERAIAYLPDEPELSAKLSAVRPGPLKGMPFLAKDLFDVAGWPTTASSTFLPKVRPAVTRTAQLVERLEEAGSVCVGKSHLNEFAYGLSGENSHFGDCSHPEDPRCLSGGSSSGSAYGVAKGWVPFALGTDTGGSIRVPASFCGVWGIRYMPEFLMDGCFPLAPSFDTIGFFTRTAAELDRINRVLVPEERGLDTESGLEPVVLFDPAWCESSVVGNHYMQALANRGFSVDLGLTAEMAKWMKVLVKAYSVLQSMEALEVHKDWIDPWKDAYDPATYGRIERARHWSSAEIADARHVRDGFLKWITDLMKSIPCLVMPVVPCPSPEKTALTESFRDKLLGLTTPGSMAGLPTITEPVCLKGMEKTLGLQYMCRGLPELTATLGRFIK